MSRSKKTRICIKINDSQKELFSILELANGDLQIILKPPSQMGQNLVGPFDDVSSDKFSIHRSPSSPGFTFKETRTQADGNKFITSAFVIPGTQNLIFPIFGRRNANLADERYDLKARPKDNIITIDTYDPQFSTLVYWVIIKDLNPQQIKCEQPFSEETIKFAHFEVIVYHTFIRIPSFHQGHHLVFCSSEMTINDNITENFLENGAICFKAEDLMPFLKFTMPRFSENFIAQVLNWYQENNWEMSQNLQKDLIVGAHMWSTSLTLRTQ